MRAPAMLKIHQRLSENQDAYSWTVAAVVEPSWRSTREGIRPAAAT
jgi:hypothetical protein